MTAFEKAADLGIKVHPGMPIGRVRAAIRSRLLELELHSFSKGADPRRYWEMRTRVPLPLPKQAKRKIRRGVH